MKPEVTALRAARPMQFQPGSAIDAATRERELAAAFSAPPDSIGHRRPAGQCATQVRRTQASRAGRPIFARPLTGLTAAALCVVLAAAGLWLAYPRSSEQSSSPPYTGVLLSAAVARPPSAAKAQAGMPPYYVIADFYSPAVEVRSTLTGQILSQVELPAGTDPMMSLISGTGGGRFVLALDVNQKAAFYLLKVSDHGSSAQLTSLPVPALPGKVVAAIALSPDGSKLAISLQFNDGNRGSVEVVTLATGAVRTWTTTRRGSPGQLSWTDHGRELGFFWTGEARSPDRRPAGGLWLLDTRSPGSDLMSGRLVLPSRVGIDAVQSATFSPDGRTIDAAVFDTGRPLQHGIIAAGIVKLSARTGRPLSTLYPQRVRESRSHGQTALYITGCALLAADATGNHLLIDCYGFGRLDRARFTALPNSDRGATDAAAW
ncbi:MAG TPA: hypothetical protein VGM14_27595 [Streptosporangiaceae bacterium]